MSVKLAVATPVRASDHYCANVSYGYMNFVMNLSRVMPVEMIDSTMTYSVDNIRARNRIAAHILRERPQVTHVLWLDDDNWADDPRLVLAMLATGEHVLGAAYTNKKSPTRWVHQHLDPPGTETAYVTEVRSVGFGFTITTTECLRRMSDAARKYTDVPYPHKIANIFGQLYDRLTPGTGAEDEECLLSEDYSFCKRWRDAGGRVAVFGGGIIEHAGMKRWSGRDIPGAIVESPVT